MKSDADLALSISHMLYEYSCEMRDIAAGSVKSGEDDVQRARVRMRNALMKTAGLVSKLNVHEGVDLEGIADDFRQLASALVDLNVGALHPILIPVDRGPGRRGDLTEAWIIRATAAAAVECWIVAGEKRDSAAALVAKASPTLNRIVREGRALEGSLLSWRDTFMSDGKAGSEAQSIFDYLKGWLKLDRPSRAPQDYRESANRMNEMVSYQMARSKLGV